MDNRIKKLLCGCSVTLLAIGVCLGVKETEICRADKNAVENFSAGYLNIGSVSKVYAVTAVMQLVDRGKVDLDAPVVNYITDFKMADERYKKITVRMLMNHTSGLMGSAYSEIFLFDEMNSDYHDRLLSLLQNEHLKSEPGEFNCYCNDGFTLLEILTERVSNMTFTEYLEENICKPLSLNNTGTMWNLDAKSQVPVYANGNVRLDPECGQALGAGGVVSNAGDVCTFGSAFFKDENVLLSENAKDLMAENNRAGVSHENFGLGWDEVVKKDYADAGVKVMSKGGDTFFQNASLVVAPDEKISVAVLSSGGSSGIDEDMALNILDIALYEQGIVVEHPEKDVPELLDTVPDKYISYEGLYADSQKTVNISFPDKHYMLVSSVTANDEFEQQYMYSENGEFVAMKGDVASKTATPQKPLQTIYFEEKDGQVYVSDSVMGYLLYKTSEKNVEDKVQNAWDKRDDVTYYYVNGSASDENYLIENYHVTLHTCEAAKGYVNGYVMKDEDHAGFETILPGTGSRDLSNVRVETSDGKEYLCMDEYNYRYISEENIPVLDENTTSVNLKTGEAAWFKIDGVKNAVLHLDIPEIAAVNVYDKYGSLRYSSHMNRYGNNVPLPEYGMIVFIGQTGEKVNFTITD